MVGRMNRFAMPLEDQSQFSNQRDGPEPKNRFPMSMGPPTSSTILPPLEQPAKTTKKRSSRRRNNQDQSSVGSSERDVLNRV